HMRLSRTSNPVSLPELSSACSPTAFHKLYATLTAALACECASDTARSAWRRPWPSHVVTSPGLSAPCRPHRTRACQIAEQSRERASSVGPLGPALHRRPADATGSLT